MSVARAAGLALHRAFTWHPRIASAYLSGWTALLDLLPDGHWLRRHIGNNLRAAEWPTMKPKPRTVELAPGVDVRVIPAPASLTFRSVYERRLRHEPGVPDFLASRLPGYDAVIEVGANVGTYTLLFARLVPADRIRVFSFEPGQRAFALLQEHLSLNGVANVAAFNCAIARASGTIGLYENSSDLMKASTHPTAAAAFAGHTRRSVTVRAMSGAELEPLVEPFERILLKVDVMGAEADVLEGLRSIIDSKSPDILLGVWGYNRHDLDARGLADRYRMYRIDHDGLTEKVRFDDNEYCNYFLEPREFR